MPGIRVGRTTIGLGNTRGGGGLPTNGFPVSQTDGTEIWHLYADVDAALNFTHDLTALGLSGIEDIDFYTPVEEV